MIEKLLLIAGIVAFILMLAAFRMSGICSREEEGEWRDGN